MSEAVQGQASAAACSTPPTCRLPTAFRLRPAPRPLPLPLLAELFVWLLILLFLFTRSVHKIRGGLLALLVRCGHCASRCLLSKLCATTKGPSRPAGVLRPRSA